MTWKRFEDRRPKVGTHILALGDGSLWWGFYNTKTESGNPPFVPIYWHKVDPLPRMPVLEVAEPEPEVAQPEKIPEDAILPIKKDKKSKK